MVAKVFVQVIVFSEDVQTIRKLWNVTGKRACSKWLQKGDPVNPVTVAADSWMG